MLLPLAQWLIAPRGGHLPSAVQLTGHLQPATGPSDKRRMTIPRHSTSNPTTNPQIVIVPCRWPYDATHLSMYLQLGSWPASSANCSGRKDEQPGWVTYGYRFLFLADGMHCCKCLDRLAEEEECFPIIVSESVTSASWSIPVESGLLL